MFMNTHFMITRLPFLVLMVMGTPAIAIDNNNNNNNGDQATPPLFTRVTSAALRLWPALNHQRQNSLVAPHDLNAQQPPRSNVAKILSTAGYAALGMATIGLFCYGTYYGYHRVFKK